MHGGIGGQVKIIKCDYAWTSKMVVFMICLMTGRLDTGASSWSRKQFRGATGSLRLIYQDFMWLPAGSKLRSAQWFQDQDSFVVDTNANERLKAAARRFRQLRSVACFWIKIGASMGVSGERGG